MLGSMISSRKKAQAEANSASKSREDTEREYRALERKGSRPRMRPSRKRGTC